MTPNDPYVTFDQLTPGIYVVRLDSSFLVTKFGERSYEPKTNARLLPVYTK